MGNSREVNFFVFLGTFMKGIFIYLKMALSRGVCLSLYQGACEVSLSHHINCSTSFFRTYKMGSYLKTYGMVDLIFELK